MNQFQKIILVVFCLSEILLFSVYRNIFGEFISPVILFILGLTIGVLPLIFFKKQNVENNFKYHSTKNWQTVILYTVALFGFLVTNTLCRHVFNNYAISVEISDIIPQIQKFVERAEHLWYPYKTISFPTYDLFPTYLPLHWAPFIIADKLHFDYRYLANGVLYLSLIFLFYHIFKSHTIAFIEKIILIVLPFVGIYTFINFDNISVGVSVEQMIMGYYIFLSTVLVTQKNIYFRSGAVLLCLLSRFSFLFWVPLFLYSIFIFEGKKQLTKAILFLTCGVLLLYIIPFVLKDPSVFLKSQASYMAGTLGEWQRNPSPHLHNGLGLSNYFLDFLSGTNAHKIHVLQLMLISISILTMLCLGFFLNKNKKKLDHRIFNMASLKIMLTVFYAFVQIPYSYLYLVPMGVSFVVLFASFNKKYFNTNNS